MSRAGNYVGKGIPMVDAERFTKGQGRYVNDLAFPAVAHVAFVRSTEAHARLKRVDVTAAREHSEAIAVLTAEDLQPVMVENYWGGWRGTSTADYYPLAREKVRWVGEPLAAVLADSRYLAEDIAELVEVDYEPLAAVTDPFASLAAEEADSLLYEEWGNNVYYHDEFVGGDVAQAFAEAAGVIKRRFSAQRHTGTPMETRGIVASYDPALRLLRVHANWQDVFLARAVISKVLGMAQAQIHITAPDSGGGFGVKLPVYPEEMACCAIAVQQGRTVKWIQDRQEDLLGTSQHRDLVVEAELAYAADGRVLGLKANILSDAGAYGVPARGNTVEGMMAAEDIVAAGHHIPTYSYSLNVVMTNKPPTCVYRGVAQPVTIFVLDRLMDELAKVTGLDRREVRRRNLITQDQFPYTCMTGNYVIESGSYIEALDRALELVDFDGFPQYQERMRAEGRLVGLGIACGGEALARGATWYGVRGLPISGQEGCLIKVDSYGNVHAQLGTTAQGQGIETTIAQIVADRIGVDIAKVTVGMGDTAISPYGAGAWASRQATLGGTAAYRAAGKIRAKLLRIAAFKLECATEDLELEDGRAFVKGNPMSSIAIEDIAHAAYFTASELPRDLEPTLEETSHFDPPSATFSNSVHAVILEVDPTTAHISFHRYVVVHDCGTVLNPMIVDGQIYGGTAQGIGGTIYEHSVFDENGQPLATTFMDYLVPTSLDVPQLEIEHLVTPSPHTALGIKGVGESGTVFAPAAIATGVSDAIGVEVNRLELNPSKVHELLSQRRFGQGHPSLTETP
jgi:carbon-monoxide dehydrogenase large subunit